MRILLLLILIVFISGCITGIEDLKNVRLNKKIVRYEKGVIIEKFEPNIDEVRGEDKIRFILKIKNKGSEIATDVFAELLGLDFEASKNEVRPIEQGCTVENPTKELRGYDKETSIEGDTMVCTWIYTAPQVPIGLQKIYNPKARVFYNYNSYIIKRITVLSLDEFIRLRDSGKTISMDTESKSDAPVEIEIISKNPIIVSENSVKFPIQIIVKNIGNGVVCKNSFKCKKSISDPEESWNMIELKINLPSGMRLDTCEESQIVELVNNKQSLSCIVEIYDIKGEIEKKNVEVVANYGYFVEKETKIKVVPRL